jgi:hypothetical protein
MSAPAWISQDEEAALDVIQMLTPFLNGKDRLRPLTRKAIKRVKQVLGLTLLPANKEGFRNWRVPPTLDIRYERAGIDPRSGICIDREKYKAVVLQGEQEKAQKKARKDEEQRKETIAEVVKGFQPLELKPRAKTANVQHFLHNDFQNRRIAREIRKAQGQEEERASLPHSTRAGHKYYPPVRQDDSGGEGIQIHKW